MQPEHTTTVGVDVIGNRYVLCILDEMGMHPLYYRGRVDTPLGQANFLARIGTCSSIILPSGLLAMLALKRLGEERVVVKEEEEHYAVWAKAGIQRGERMARFAALLLFASEGESDPLSQKDQLQMLAMQQAELDQLLGVVETSQDIASSVLDGQADAKIYVKALRNEQTSRTDPVIGTVIKEVEKASPFSDDDTSFLATIHRLLKEVH